MRADLIRPLPRQGGAFPFRRDFASLRPESAATNISAPSWLSFANSPSLWVPHISLLRCGKTQPSRRHKPATRAQYASPSRKTGDNELAPRPSPLQRAKEPMRADLIRPLPRQGGAFPFRRDFASLRPESAATNISAPSWFSFANSPSLRVPHISPLRCGKAPHAAEARNAGVIR